MGLFDGFSGSEEGLKNSAFEAIKAELDKQDMKYGEDVTGTARTTSSACANNLTTAAS